MSEFNLIVALIASFIAGAINSVAGGGSMISFPVLVMMGVPPIIANTTNTVGLWPGAIGSLYGFREELARIPRGYYWLLLPAVIGSAGGAFLLRHTSATSFERIIPVLIIFATVMFMIAPSVRQILHKKSAHSEPRTLFKTVLILALQICVAVYGGYFGAGMSILMLSVLSLIGMTDMLEMAAMTSLLSLSINGTAGLIFSLSGLIDWKIAGVMAIGSITGGYSATGIARKVGSSWIRRLVIAVGVLLAVTTLWHSV
jgi:uncharacterized membrane protein YfcA